MSDLASGSEGFLVVAIEEFSVHTAVVAHDADHLVHGWDHLNAAGKSHEGGVALVSRVEAALFSLWLFVQLVEPGVGDMHGTLCAVNSSRVEIDWHLEGPHLVFLVTTSAVGPDAGCLVSLEHFEETLTGASGVATGNTIGRHAVDPDNMVRHFDATIGR